VAIAFSISLVHCVCQNYNWYQSRHHVLYLGELQGKILSGTMDKE
ncbi:hypothetical protein A2U01_0081685, partial [Trifolium medium]|nr:hypothetical protein [Trifolium medium]